MKKFLRNAFYENHWLWFHVLAGGTLAKLIPVWQVALIALLWEVGEYFLSPFGRSEKFFADAFGDVFGAVLMALIVAIALPF